MPKSKPPRKARVTPQQRVAANQIVTLPRFQAIQPRGRGHKVSMTWWRYDRQDGSMEPLENPALMIADLIRLAVKVWREPDATRLTNLILAEMAKSTADERGEHTIS